MYIQNVNLDVNAQPDANAKPCLRLSQNENGRVLMIRIIGVDIPGGSTANFAGLKPDGNVYSKPGTVDGNVVSIEEDIQMTAVSGSWNAKITIVNDGNTICTARIRVVVDASVVPGGAIPSDSQLDGIVAECQAYAESAKSAAYGSPLTASTAADMTDQDRVYVYTGSESGYTSGHWYYWDGTAWTDGGVYNSVAVDTDTTLSISGKAADAKKTGDEISELKEDLNAIQTATSEDVGKVLKAKTVTNGKVTEWEFGEAGGGSPFDLPTATNLITILRNCVFTKDVSINIDNLAEALGINSGDDDDDDDMTFTYGQSIPKGNTARTLELTGMTIALTEIRLVVSLHSDFAQGGFCWVQAPNAGTPYVGVDGNGDFYWSNKSGYSGSFSATPSDLSDFVDTIKEVKILWLNPSGYESRKYLSGFKFFFNNYNPSCGYTLYRCSGFDGSTEVFRLESSGTNGELYDVLTGTTYTFNNTTGMEIVEVSE